MHGLLPLGLLALVCSLLSGAVTAEDDQDDSDECERNMPSLDNDQGETPCTVANQLILPCLSSRASTEETDDYLDHWANNSCTCNTVVYNLLSACRTCRKETTVSFRQWTSKCTLNAIDVTYNDYPSQQNTNDTHIPGWAYISLATDHFDKNRAMKDATRWSPLQIATPIIAGGIMLLLFGVFFIWYRARHTASPLIAPRWRISSIFSRAPKAPAHFRLRSWPVDTDSSRDTPRDSSYSDAPSPDHKPAKAINGLLKGIQKFKGPIPVTSVPRRQGFRIDDTDVSTKAGSRKSTLDFAAAAAMGAGEDERSVLLISRAPGENFTIESTVHSPLSPRAIGVDVVPASPVSPALPNPHSDPSTSRYITPRHSPSSSYEITPFPRALSPPVSPNYSYMQLPRLARTDPSNLIPASVRSAGYDPFRASISSNASGLTHSRNVSAETVYWTGSPGTPPGNLRAGEFGARVSS